MAPRSGGPSRGAWLSLSTVPSQLGPRLFPGCLLELQPYSPAASISALPESVQAQVLAGTVGWGWVAARLPSSRQGLGFGLILTAAQLQASREPHVPN